VRRAGGQAFVPGKQIPADGAQQTAKITVTVTDLRSIIPLPIVLATAVPKIANATKLKNAAQTTASRGDRTRVATIVEIELAESCMPLVKSKTNATITATTTKIVIGSIWPILITVKPIDS